MTFSETQRLSSLVISSDKLYVGDRKPKPFKKSRRETDTQLKEIEIMNRYLESGEGVNLTDDQWEAILAKETGIAYRCL